MNRIGDALSWSLAQHGIRLMVALLTSLGLARYLGPDLFGTYQSLLSWLLLFVALSAGGLQSVVIQRLAAAKEPAASILGSALKMRLVWTGVSVLICLTIPALLSWPDAEMLGLLILVPVLAVQLGDLADYYFQSRLENKRVTIARTISTLASLILVLIGILLDAGLHWFLVVFLVEQVMGFLLLVYLNQRYGLPVKAWKFDTGVAAELWRDAWPMLGANVGFLLYTRIDVVMLSEMLGQESAGYFAASSRLSQLWNFIPLAIVGAIFPRLARIRESQPELYREQGALAFGLLGATGFSLAIVLSLGSPIWIPWLFGDAYLPAIPLLSIQGGIAFLYFVRTGMDRYWVTEKKTQYSFLFHLATALANIALNLWWIPKWGAVGAAWASLVAMALGAWVFPFLPSSTRQGSWHALKGSFSAYKLLGAKGRKALLALLRQNG